MASTTEETAEQVVASKLNAEEKIEEEPVPEIIEKAHVVETIEEAPDTESIEQAPVVKTIKEEAPGNDEATGAEKSTEEEENKK